MSCLCWCNFICCNYMCMYTLELSACLMRENLECFITILASKKERKLVFLISYYVISYLSGFLSFGPLTAFYMFWRGGPKFDEEDQILPRFGIGLTNWNVKCRFEKGTSWGRDKSRYWKRYGQIDRFATPGTGMSY